MKIIGSKRARDRKMRGGGGARRGRQVAADMDPIPTRLDNEQRYLQLNSILFRLLIANY